MQQQQTSTPKEQTVFPVPTIYQQRDCIDNDIYQCLYQESLSNPDAFWRKQAQRIKWMTPFTRVKDVSFNKEDLHIRWFQDGTLNVTDNCIDRHLEHSANKPAIIWEPDNPEEKHRIISYKELHQEVCQLANGLLALGIKQGDVVTIYMPMIPEAAIAMLACARIGAPHSVVFGGFSAEALADRIDDCQSQVVITADEGIRGGKKIPLKNNVDLAIQHCHTAKVSSVVVVQRTAAEVTWVDDRDHWYSDVLIQQSPSCKAVELNAEQPLFVLYTSGSTGKPKGVVHTSGGYLLHASITHAHVFDYQQNDIFWCTADVGWITGHSYVLYGPLSNGGTTVMFEGVPNYPDANRMASIIDKHKINTLYTAPTAIRALMADGDKAVRGCSLESIRLLGSVGEPINPEAWRWYHREFGRNECPIVDTWWQTETGGIMLTPLPGATALKPGSATRPFFGVQPALVNSEGTILEGAISGNLVMLDSWPGQARTIYGDHQRFIDTYFSAYPGMYFSSDGARRDEDGYYWITGRVDDVLNVAGHRMGTAELESAMVAHPVVAEAAVVGIPHDIKGQGIYIYVTLNNDGFPTDELRTELRQWLRTEIGAIATPDIIQWAPGLPKTRSGKIMRRILRKIAENQCDQLGDISTLSDPEVVQDLINNRVNI